MPGLTGLGRAEGAGYRVWLQGPPWREAAPVPALRVWFSKGSAPGGLQGLALLSVFLRVRNDGPLQETPNLDGHRPA